MRPSAIPLRPSHEALHEAASETLSAVSEVPFDTRPLRMVNYGAKGTAELSHVSSYLSFEEFQKFTVSSFL